MLVRVVAFCRLLVAVMFAFSAAFPAFADEKPCEATEEFYNKIAGEAITALKTMSDELTKYNEHVVKSIKATDAPCFLLNTEFNHSNAQTYGWSGFDAQGMARAGKENAEELKKLMDGMDLSNIDTDFPAYEYKNSGHIAAANIEMKIAQNQEIKQKIMEELLGYKQCGIELFNLQQEQSKIKELREDASVYLKTLASTQNTVCTCDINQLKTCTTVTETPEEQAPEDLSCKNLNEFTQDTAFCPTCLIFEKILLADQKLAGGAFGALAGSLVKLLSLGFLIYVAIQTLMLVSSPASQTLGKYMTSLTIQGFKVLIAVLILTSPSFLYDLVLKPVIEGGLDFGITLTGGSQASILDAGTKYTKFSTTDSLLSAPFLQKMIGAADVFNEQASIMPAMGRAMICNAFHNLEWNVVPNIETMLEGLIVVVFGYIISLSVGFYLLDLTLELGFLCCLLPFLVACWPFKITSRYTKVGWGIFMHIFFNYVMLGVIITAINAISKRAITPNGDVQTLVNALNTNDFNTIKSMMEIGGMQMILLIVSCYICLKLLKDVNNLANKFSGGAGFNISPGIGGLAASAAFMSAKNGGSALFKNIASGAGAMSDASGLTGAAKAGVSTVKEGVKSATGYNKLSRGMKNFTAAAGIGENAVEHGGRQDYNSGNDFKTSSEEGSGASEDQNQDASNNAQGEQATSTNEQNNSENQSFLKRRTSAEENRQDSYGSGILKRRTGAEENRQSGPKYPRPNDGGN